ncbi:MAG: helical backbone metal receptor [Deltaproteobacteria bacterium]|nr:helical backbone metal receptor [Myxococcales bacterium]MDP3220853.1 helical backbone metal receptor [Deltaproteobacteria bacterium]
MKRALAAALALSLAACERRAPPGPALPESFTAVDDRAPAPRRVVCLVPSATELVFALGAGDRVVGVSAFDDYPPEVTRLPRIGGMTNPSFEGIAALRPDAVVGVEGPTDLAALRRLRSLGVRVVVPRVESVAEVLSGIDLLGRLLHRAPEAAALRARIARELDAVRSRVTGRPRPRTLVVLGRRPLVVAGPGSWIDEVVSLAGGANVVTGGGRYPTVPREALAAMRPEVILDLTGHAEGAALRDELAGVDLPALRQGRVSSFGDPMFLRPGPRVAESARQIAAALHPH